MGYFIGIDTSNYTTSLAVVDANGEIICDLRQLLKVKTGEKGLRQSDAFYQHVLILPELIEKLPQIVLSELHGIGVSTQPRPMEGSYMPVFNAGMKMAAVMGKMVNLEPFPVSHQEGHIMASLYDRQDWLQEELISIHASGGTTEILRSVFDLQTNRFAIERIGGTKDISFGQLIDRIGVTLGFEFPCGNAMEAALKNSYGELLKDNLGNPIRQNKNAFNALMKVNDCSFNLSGFENKAYQLLEAGLPQMEIVRDLFEAIGILSGTALQQAMAMTGIRKIVLAGGVMSNSLIREALMSMLGTQGLFEVHCGQPKLCTDNAVGVALISRARLNTLL